MDTAISILILIAAFTWLLVLITTCVVAMVILWRRRGLRTWIADFDRTLEREERERAFWKRRCGG